MKTVLVFAAALYLAVLISERARRSLLSTAVLFLVVGLAAGATGLVPLPSDERVGGIAELVLVVSLFTDGAKIDFAELRASPGLPVRALLFGLPISFLATALVAKPLFDLPWLHCFLLGAALSPTDPVLASAIVGSESVPLRVRRLLNVESGMNDGLAVPLVLVLLGVASGHHAPVLVLLGQVALGIAIGAILPAVAVWIYRRGPFEASSTFKPIFALSVLLVAWSTAKLVHANEYLASFAAGVVLSNISEKARAHWEMPGEAIVEVMKLGAILLFGAAISHESIAALGWHAVLFGGAALFLARPLSMAIALGRGRLELPEKLVTWWFGPRGFSSIVLALIIKSSGIEHARELFDLVAIVVVASIVLHSSTDTLVAKKLTTRDRAVR